MTCFDWPPSFLVIATALADERAPTPTEGFFKLGGEVVRHQAKAVALRVDWIVKEIGRGPE